MPVPGDVDIVIASELMEAGRAVQRGFVTPDRTTLIASTHRVYAMTERIALADGRVDDDGAARRLPRGGASACIAFDMAAIAEATGSVISAVLFGALAGSGALPFPRAAFEAAIRRGGVGVAASLAAFTAGFEAATSGAAPASRRPARCAPPTPDGSTAASCGRVAPSRSRDARRRIPRAQPIVRAGVERTADYQDADYARLYLDAAAPIASSAAPTATGACSPRPRASSRSAWPTRTRSASPS